MLMRVWDWLPIDVTITIITLAMIIIMITAVWLQNNQSLSLCDWTDNSLITFFTINKFCTRNLQSIWYATYLSLLFSTVWVKLMQIQFVVCLAFLVFFRNHTQKNCIMVFFDPLIRKHLTHAMYTNDVATCLEL